MLLRMARKKKKNLDSVESVSMSHCFRVAMDARLHHDAWTTSSVTWAYLADVWLPAAYMQTWEICTGQVGVQSSVTERMIWRVGRIHCWKKKGAGRGGVPVCVFEADVGLFEFISVLQFGNILHVDGHFCHRLLKRTWEKEYWEMVCCHKGAG